MTSSSEEISTPGLLIHNRTFSMRDIKASIDISKIQVFITETEVHQVLKITVSDLLRKREQHRIWPFLVDSGVPMAVRVKLGVIHALYLGVPHGWHVTVMHRESQRRHKEEESGFFVCVCFLCLV